MAIEYPQDVCMFDTTVNTMELIIVTLNEFLMQYPQPAPGSDNSEYDVSKDPAAVDSEEDSKQ
jgi:hypothetical protein